MCADPRSFDEFVLRISTDRFSSPHDRSEESFSFEECRMLDGA